MRINFSRSLTNTKVHLRGKFTSAKQRLLLNVASLYQNSSCPRPTGLSRLKNKFRNAFVHVLVFLFLLKCFAAHWLYQHSQFLPSGRLVMSENSPESGKERNKNSLFLHKLTVSVTSSLRIQLMYIAARGILQPLQYLICGDVSSYLTAGISVEELWFVPTF